MVVKCYDPSIIYTTCSLRVAQNIQRQTIIHSQIHTYSLFRVSKLT